MNVALLSKRVSLVAVIVAMVSLAAFSLVGGGTAPLPSAQPANPSPTSAALSTVVPTITDAPPSSAPTPTVGPPSSAPSSAPSDQTPPSSYAPLNGMPADPERASRLPIAVMVDNNGRARPQSGFSRASIVYHAPTDGGTSRYMFIFQERDAELIGPIRSSRLFFSGWAMEYRAAFAHFGGDGYTLNQLREADGDLLYDMDALAGSARAYWRDAARRAPFNAYTDSRRLRAEASRIGAPRVMVPGLAQRVFADDLPAAERPRSGRIKLPYRSYAVAYDYDHEQNLYRRSVKGEPHRDALDGSRVTARNVIVQFVDVIYDTNIRNNLAVMDYIGSGRAIVFRDGLAIKGTWRKQREGGLTRFLDAAGNEISLVRGPIFIQVIADAAKVTYEVGPLR
jgi:hypothetical protein